MSDTNSVAGELNNAAGALNNVEQYFDDALSTLKGELSNPLERGLPLTESALQTPGLPPATLNALKSLNPEQVAAMAELFQKSVEAVRNRVVDLGQNDVEGATKAD